MKDRFKTFHEGQVPPEIRKQYAELSDPHDSHPHNYEHYLNFSLAELKGSKVLDIGGTMDGDFARAAEAEGIDLTTLDPQNIYQTWGGKNVRAIMQQLPFKDSSFDVEVSFGAIPFIPNYDSEYRSTLSEVIRTLKPKGKGIIFPITDNVYDAPAFHKILAELEDVAVVRLEDVDVSDSKLGYDDKGNPVKVHRLILIKK